MLGDRIHRPRESHHLLASALIPSLFSDLSFGKLLLSSSCRQSMVPSSAGDKVQAKSPFQKGIAVHQGEETYKLLRVLQAIRKELGVGGGLLGGQQVSLSFVCRYGEGHRQAGRRVGQGVAMRTAGAELEHMRWCLLKHAQLTALCLWEVVGVLLCGLP